MIPREGVERISVSAQDCLPERLGFVIPREGVESDELRGVDVIVATVIPREGVESDGLSLSLSRLCLLLVIPREGVEINVSEHLLGP